MKGEDGVPSLNDWITQELKAGDKVGMSAKFVSIGKYTREMHLRKYHYSPFIFNLRDLGITRESIQSERHHFGEH